MPLASRIRTSSVRERMPSLRDIQANQAGGCLYCVEVGGALLIAE